MKNINTGTLDNLSNKIKELEDGVSSSVSWVQTSPDLRMEKEASYILQTEKNT
mgnify:CR=1 FL=1